MVQLRVLSGSAAGAEHDARTFPVTVGRNSNCHLALREPGVFDRHFQIQFSSDGFSLIPESEAPVTVNGEPSAGGLLRNGDVIGAGYAKIQFWLAAMPQRGLRVRETISWALIVAMILAQAYLLTQLLAIAR